MIEQYPLMLEILTISALTLLTFMLTVSLVLLLKYRNMIKRLIKLNEELAKENNDLRSARELELQIQAIGHKKAFEKMGKQLHEELFIPYYHLKEGTEEEPQNVEEPK